MGRITLDKVSKRFGDVEVIPPLDLTIEDGEFTVFVGPSGCGKSTTLRMIAGLEEITSGEIHIGDRRVNDVAPKDRDIAMVFQNYALFTHMTVEENLAFPLEARKVPKPEIASKISRAMEMVQLGGFGKRGDRASSLAASSSG